MSEGNFGIHNGFSRDPELSILVWDMEKGNGVGRSEERENSLVGETTE